MSIFDELLILTDDQTEITLDQATSWLPSYRKQALSSTLGRLESKGWLYTENSGKGKLYRVSDQGNNYLDQILGTIRQTETEWDGTWFCTLVSLPESERKKRDSLRHYFVQNGYGRIIDGLWVSPWQRHSEITQITRDFRTGTHILSFTTQKLGRASTQLFIQRAWDWEAIRRNNQDFIEKAQVTVREITKHFDITKDEKQRFYRRLAAKNFTFEYAKHLRSQANLPDSIAPDKDQQIELRTLYQAVRPFCYQ